MHLSLSRSSVTDSQESLAMQVCYLGLEMAQLSQLNIFLQESAGGADAKNVHQLSPAPVSEEPEESRGATFDPCEFSFGCSLACGPKTGPRQGAGPRSAPISAEGPPRKDQPAEGWAPQPWTLQATTDPGSRPAWAAGPQPGRTGPHLQAATDLVLGISGDMEVVRILLLVVLSLSYFYNCYLGMEYTYMFPQTACVIFTAAFLTCFTGFFSLLEYQRRATNSSLPSETETASQGSDFRMQSGSSIQVISLPETPPPPPSIVRVRSQESRNSDIPKPTQIQKRRVTWAL